MPVRLPFAPFILLVCLGITPLAHAQSEPEVEGAKRPLWEAGVAGFGVKSPAYPGAIESVSRGLVIPWFVYRGPVLRAEGGAVGARLLKTQTVEFDVGFAGSLGASSNDVQVRQGMPSLGFQFEFGPRARINLARPSADAVVRLDLPLRGVFEANSGIKQRGFAFEPRLSYADLDIGRGWGATASASLVMGDQKLNQFYYGVPSQYATPTRVAYNAKSGLITPRLQLSLSHRLNDDVRLFGFVRADFPGSGANRDSPLHLKDSGTAFGVGAVWTFGRSGEMAAN
ncbi:MAG: MipA/OmpV family protein [Burkholderiales bacterium]